MMERHPILGGLFQAARLVPGVTPASRWLARSLIQGDCLSLKNRQRVYNFIAPKTIPAQTLAFSTRLPVGGTIRLELDLHDDLSRMWYFWGYRGYETATTRLFTRLLGTKTCVFDIGANFGYYSLLAAAVLSASKRGGTVHAFEPNPNVFRRLTHNAGLNGFSCLVMNPQAVCDVDGQQTLYLRSAEDAGTNASLVAGLFAQQNAVTVNTVRLDTYCDKHAVGPVDLIKMDCEGAEARVIQGMGKLLDAWRPDIICEVLEPCEDELEQLFQSTPYKRFLVTDSGLFETDRLRADTRYRDYFFTCAAASQPVEKSRLVRK